jgi:hypothetical protein
METRVGERDIPRCHHEVLERHMKAKTKRSIFARFFVGARERRWDRDRRRRIAKLLERERATVAATADWMEAMAVQLAEIRALPEVTEPLR